MTATATRDLSVEAEPASEKIANALQLIAPVTAARHLLDPATAKLHEAMERAQEQEAAYGAAREIIAGHEAERRALMEEIRFLHDAHATAQLVEKALRRFLADLDRDSDIPLQVMQHEIESHARRLAAQHRGD